MFRMNGITRIGCALALLVSTGATMVPATAEAGHRHHGHGSDLLAAGVIGAFIGSAIARPHPVYVAPPPPVVYYPPEPVYYPPAPIYYPPATVYVDPVPVYPAPSYSGPSTPYYDRTYAHPRRHRLNELQGRHDRAWEHGSKSPRVITYEDTVSGETGSAAWLDYCRRKFRSFDAASGTYLGFDGKRHACIMR